jgi:hypothetical protein
LTPDDAKQTVLFNLESHDRASCRYFLTATPKKQFLLNTELKVRFGLLDGSSCDTTGYEGVVNGSLAFFVAEPGACLPFPKVAHAIHQNMNGHKLLSSLQSNASLPTISLLTRYDRESHRESYLCRGHGQVSPLEASIPA